MTSKSYSVLVVEDERIVALDVQQQLINLGYDAYAVASSGEEAIARATERCPDIVLMDIRIEGALDGIEVAGILRERFGIPSIFLTAHADEATIQRAKKTEPFGYLVKPVHPAELSRSIEIAMFRSEMEKRLRERERWFFTTLQSIADAVIAVDLAGNVNFMNAAAEVLTGFKAGEVMGRPAAEVLLLVDSHSQAPAETPLDTALRQDGPVTIELSGLQNGTTGTVRMINDSAARVMDRGRMLGAVMVFRDVTDERNAGKQLELSDRLASLGTMAASVAHEIKNPLSVVVANLEVIVELMRRNRSEIEDTNTRLPPDVEMRLKEIEEALSDVGSAGDRINKIVSDLSTFSRPEPHSGLVDVRRAAEWAIRATGYEMRYRAKMRTSFSDVPLVAADEAKLGQVLVNLLLNAAHAIEPGNVARNEVSITTSLDPKGCVVISVKDTGAGIAPELREHIFEPFFTTKPIGSGTGLGLSICHGIVTSFGGELQVESQVGQGSTFRVILAPAVETEAARTEPDPRPKQTRQARILVVDDESSVQRAMRRILEMHEVVTASSGREALDLLLAGESFDLIFSDMMMPDMTGMDLYGALVESFTDVAKRVVFVSGGGMTPQTRDFLAAVANPRVEKPFSIGKLRDTVDELLAQLPALDDADRERGNSFFRRRGDGSEPIAPDVLESELGRVVGVPRRS